MRIRTMVLLPLLALGCQGVGLSPYTEYQPGDGDTDPSGGQDTDTSPDTDGAEDTDSPVTGSPRITAIDPDFGTNAGGTAVTLTGMRLTRGLKVEFGGESATVISTDGTTAVVESPAVSVAGKVTVKVIGGSGSDTLPDSFRYWADADGKIGGIFILDKSRYRGDYWTDPDLAWSAVYGGYLQPMAGFEFWKLFTQTQGTCTHNYSGGPTLAYRDPGATQLTMTGGGTTIDMPEDSALPGFFSSENMALTAAPSSTAWQLDPVTGPLWWPSFSIPDLLRGEDNFELNSPAIHSTLKPYVSKGFDLRWTGSGGDYMIVILTHYTNSGTSVVQEVTCSLPDTGSYSIPSSTWPSWKRLSTDYIRIMVGRVKTRTDELPMDRSTVVGLSQSWVIGAAGMN